MKKTIKNKVCTKCGDKKLINEFNSDKTRKDGYRCYCKLCGSKMSKKWRSNNKEKSTKYNKEWKKNNPESKKKTNQKWLENNPEKKKRSDKRWNDNNKERKKITQTIWSKNNIEKTRETARKAMRKTRANKPHITAWRKVLSSSLKRMGKKKKKKL